MNNYTDCSLYNTLFLILNLKNIVCDKNTNERVESNSNGECSRTKVDDENKEKKYI
jgi:hypothetical protein